MESDSYALGTGEDRVDLGARRCAPMSTLVPLLFAVIFVEFPLQFFSLHLATTESRATSANLTNAMVKVLLHAAACIALLVYCALRWQQAPRGNSQTFSTYSFSHCLQVVFCLLYTSSSIFDLVSDALVTTELEYTKELFGRGEFSSITIYYTFSVMIAPLLLGVIFSDALREIVWVWWALSLGCLVAVSLIRRDGVYGFLVAIYFLYSLLIFFSIRKNALLVYLKEVVQERQVKEKLDAQDVNMKHIVANVAHDLKTPLSSFMAGVDVVDGIMADVLTQLCQLPYQELSPLKQALDTAKQCLSSLSHTNSFMVLTINKCIEYTKASKGLKLVPKYETLQLYDTLSLPLHCMKNIQDRVSIVMAAIPFDICSHVITDKQWLQENLLCLLSNAVKYSAGGSITVRVSLENETGAGAASPGAALESFSLRVSSQSYSLYRNNEGSSFRAVVPELSSERKKKSGEPMYLKYCPVHRYKHNNVVPLLGSPENSLDKRLFPSASSCRTSTQFLRVEVEDQGIGMSDEAMAALFSPFKQNQRLAGGTGLGLFSLAKRMESLGGRCGVRKRRDEKQGSLFWFSFPYRSDHITSEGCRAAHALSLHSFSSDEEEGEKRVKKSLYSPALSRVASREDLEGSSVNDEATLAPSVMGRRNLLHPSTSADTLTLGHNVQLSSSVGSGQGIPNGFRVLIVDDSPMILRLTSMLLKKEGYEVHTAYNGAVALEIIEQQESIVKGAGNVFDAILMDLQMPVMDGLEAVRRLREGDRRKGRHHVVFGLSANSDEETVREVRASGFDAFLTKPFQMSAFLDLFHSFVSNI